MIKKKLYFFVTFMLVVLIGGHFSSFAATQEIVDVGLIYGANNQYPLGVSSTKGFVFGTYDFKFIPIVDLTNYKSLRIIKDGFFETTKNGDRQLITSDQNYYSTGQVAGGYHLSFGDSYDTYESALDAYIRIKAIDSTAYLVLDGKWKIFIGAYVTENAAVQNIATYQNKFPDRQIGVSSVNPNRVIIYSDNLPIFSYDTSAANYFFNTTIFEINNVKYRNSFAIKRIAGSDFTFINRVTLQEYLYGVVPKEMNGEWPIEALKAQAVAARNFVLASSNQFAKYGFDVCSTVSSQVYGGYSAEKPQSNLAVDLTNKTVLTYNQAIVPLYYHSNSAGMTDVASNVWSSDLPYIQSIEDPFSIGSPNTDWTLTMSRSDIEQKLIIGGYNIGSIESIKILQRAPSGRVINLEFTGSTGKATFPKEKLRSILGSTILKSMMFSFDANTSTIAVNNVPKTASATKTVTAAVSANINLKASPITAISPAGTFGELAQDQMLKVTTNQEIKLYKVDRVKLLNARDIYVDLLPALNAYVFPQTEIYNLSSGNVVFYGHGYGHGLGMSQYGAKNMAENGYSYENILAHYYLKTIIQQMD